MQVVHLTAVRDNFDAMLIGQGTDLLCFRETSDPVCIELENVKGFGLYQVIEAKTSVLVFPARKRNIGVLFKSCEVVDLIGEQQLFHPAKVVRLQQFQQLS